ncbi:MAG: Hsp33 family molecular chaperone HslO [Methanobrevibacter sp.]|nr:Hsp33 family molecular chaperone HslO [Methanobrevibacter sp.]
MNMDNLFRYITDDGSAFIHVIDSTNIVKTMHMIHNTSATASAALGRSLTVTSLMGAGLMKDENSLTLQIKGNGPIGSIVAVSDHDGNVRGYCDNPAADFPSNSKGKLDVGNVVGHDGTLYVIKDLGLDRPYIGQVPIKTGEIAEDIVEYYAVSEQVPTVCSLGVLVDKDLSIRSAGGFLLQLLPGADDSIITQLEKNISSFPSISFLLDSGKSPFDIANMVFESIKFSELDHSYVEYRCTCSRDRMERVLISLGKEELHKLSAEQEQTEIVCHFCNKKYVFSSDELNVLI